MYTTAESSSRSDLYPKNKTVAFAVHESHCYFYSSARACRALAHRREVEYEKLRRECKSSTTPSFDEWKPWAQQLEPGHFFVDTEELLGVGAWFLAGGRHPKCILKDEIRLKSLVYNLTKRDNEKGTVVIHGLPEEAGDIQRWLKKLGVDLPYRGEGLPPSARGCCTI